jgi:hypothetical protein
MNVINTQHKKRGIALAVAGVMLAPLAQAADVNISGFLSVGGGFVDDEDSIAYGGYDQEDLKFNRNLLGLQVTGQVNEKITATAQMIARSGEDYELTAEWAYLTWQATDNSKVRVGRLRTPFYMFSDYVDVGYSYAWISAPQGVYYLPFNNVNGIDYYVTSAFGSFDTSFQVYYGSFDDDFELTGIAATAESKNQMGVAATIGKDWWTLRTAYHQTELTINFSDFPLNESVTFNGFLNALSQSPFPDAVSRILVDEDDTNFAEIGINIDTGRFVAAAEYIQFEVDDSFLSKNIRQYVMVGMRWGDFLFHVTSAKSDDELADPAAGIPVNDQTAQLVGTIRAIAATRGEFRDTISFGTRWDVSSGVALKLQVDDVDDINGEQKVFSVALQSVF